MTGNCPLRPDGDEWFYVIPALRMAQTFTFNPLWLSHPASTTMYPLLFYYHFLNAVCFHGALFANNADIDNILFDNIFLLCYLPRFMDVFALVGCVPLVYGIAKSVFDRATAVCASFIFAITPPLVSLAQIIRSDCPALFFSLLAIYAIIKLVQTSSWKFVILAGVAIGLALSSRYNTLALVPLYIIANAKVYIATKTSGDTWRVMLLGLAGLLIAFVVFALTTPYLFLDFETFCRNMAAERRDLNLGRDGLTPLQNIQYYVTAALPYNLDKYVPILAFMGLVISFFGRRFEAFLLLLYGLMVLVGTSMHPCHDERWMVPTFPIFALFASAAIAKASSFAGMIVERVVRKKVAILASIIVMAISVTALKMESFRRICLENTGRIYLGTEGLFYQWVLQNMPPGTAICCVGVWGGAHRERYKIKDVLGSPAWFEEANQGKYLSPEQIAREGFAYFICTDAYYPAYFNEPQRYAKHCRFYKELWANSKIVKQFVPQKISVGGLFETMQNGPTYTLYKYGEKH